MITGQSVERTARMLLTRQAVGLCLLIVVSVFTACSHPREAFLKDSVEEATQEEILQELGEPLRKKTSLLNGETVWIYRYVVTDSEINPMGLGTLGKGVTKTANAAAALIGKGGPQGVDERPICMHYLLTFDKEKVLQTWKREECSQTDL